MRDEHAVALVTVVAALALVAFVLRVQNTTATTYYRAGYAAAVDSVRDSDHRRERDTLYVRLAAQYDTTVARPLDMEAIYYRAVGDTDGGAK